MSIGQQPSVFVSSTCYDLGQVRSNLRSFFGTIGIIPVMSEYNTFPVDPNLDNVTNCLEGIKARADLFVLIIGGRYGSVTDNGKSITNVEYMEAKAKGIPIYVFIRKDILNNLPIWEKNPHADFLGVVDSPKLFEFVKSIYDSKENWIYPFEGAEDIIDTLRRQLAYLFKDALDLRSKTTRVGLPEYLSELSGQALIIALQKPFAWEYRLFAQVVADEVKKASALKRDMQYNVILGRSVRGVYLNNLMQCREWVTMKIDEIQRLVESTSTVVQVVLKKPSVLLENLGILKKLSIRDKGWDRYIID